jgi:hypothetical protein
MVGLSVVVGISTAMPPFRGHHTVNSCKPRPLVILLATQAIVVRACEEDGVAVALGVTLANNDVAVAVNLCGVHGSLSLVVTCNDLLKQGLIFKVKHDGSERVFPVIEKNTLGVGQ